MKFSKRTQRTTEEIVPENIEMLTLLTTLIWLLDTLIAERYLSNYIFQIM